jgi:hypothetical protein
VSPLRETHYRLGSVRSNSRASAACSLTTLERPGVGGNEGHGFRLFRRPLDLRPAATGVARRPHSHPLLSSAPVVAVTDV